MARQRFIWPDLWTDPVIGRLDSDAALFFIGCFSNADDDGRLLADPAYLRSTIFPYRDFTTRDVEEIRDRTVAACDNLILYKVEGKPILAFTKWTDYQKPKYPKPSKLPPPRKRKRAPLSQKRSGKPSEALREASGKPSETFPQASPTGLGRDGLGTSLVRGRRKLATRAPGSLPTSKQRHLQKLLTAIGPDADPGTTKTLAALLHALPEAAAAKAHESLLSQNGSMKTRAGYAINTLKAEYIDYVATRPTKTSFQKALAPYRNTDLGLEAEEAWYDKHPDTDNDPDIDNILRGAT